LNSNGNIVNAAPSPLKFNTSDIPPRPTSAFATSVNLDSRELEPSVAVFDQTDTRSFNFTTSGTTYDSLGNPHVMTMYFVRTATPGLYDVYGTNDGGPTTDVDLGAGPGAAIQLTFDTTGQLTTAMPLNASVTLANGAINPLNYTLDFTGSSNYGSVESVTAMSQNGYTSGRLSGFDVSSVGVIVGRYTNGQSRDLGQVVLADFVNTQGLQSKGDNLWQDTVDSGLPLVSTPGSGTIGNLQSGAVEDSNVELTSELVSMITAQRVYQANAQTIKTQDAILQTIVNLR